MAVSCLENGYGGRRAKSVMLAPGECLRLISPASGEKSNNKPASGFVSEKNLGEPGAMLSRLHWKVELKHYNAGC